VRLERLEFLDPRDKPEDDEQSCGFIRLPNLNRPGDLNENRPATFTKLRRDGRAGLAPRTIERDRALSSAVDATGKAQL